MMQVVDTIAGFRKALDAERAAGKTVGLVPTMGALHAGHASLIDAAARTNDVVAVTIFVNPLAVRTERGPHEVPAAPRSRSGRRRRARRDLRLHPSVEEMYGPTGTTVLTTVRVAGITDADGRRGAPRSFRRRGDGRREAVQCCRSVAPRSSARRTTSNSRSCDGWSDDLSFPVEIVGCPIVREPDGLALSSRNVYLSPRRPRRRHCAHRALKAPAPPTASPIRERLVRPCSNSSTPNHGRRSTTPRPSSPIPKSVSSSPPDSARPAFSTT